MGNRFEIKATLVADEFIDHYMSAANGEYVKAYLFLLRHRGERITVSMIADALNHTEADVKRAISYWERAGVLPIGSGEEIFAAEPAPSRSNAAAAENGAQGAADEDRRKPAEAAKTARRQGPPVWAGRTGTEAVHTPGAAEVKARMAPPEPEKRPAPARQTAESAGRAVAAESAGRAQAAEVAASGNGAESGQAAAVKRPAYTAEQVNQLAGDEEFSQLLYIAQKYMNKVFTQRECETFAYLYDGLHMSAELLEYVVEYCVQGGHSSIRYIETVALNWHENHIDTVEKAKMYSSSFTKDSFAVMKAFGINDRKPGISESEMIERWFKIYGFTRELVVEACNRTLESAHTPSFKYADKILSEWRKAGVKNLEDVRRLDEKRLAGRSRGQEAKSGTAQSKAAKNQFHNFQQRDIDYDALILQQLRDQ